VTDADSLYEACAELLAAAASALDEVEPGAPGRQYVAGGQVAFDCEQLTVHPSPIGLAETEPASGLEPARRIVRANVNLVGLVLTLIRCVPAVKTLNGGNIVLPTPAEMDTSSRIGLRDGWQLWNGLKQRHRDNTLLPSHCRDVLLSPCIPLDPAGGLGGWTLTVRTNLDGIPASTGS
jgi:hypothetical protein